MKDPAVAAIRRTRAEELSIVIESLVRRLEQLDIEDRSTSEDTVRLAVLTLLSVLNVS